MKNGGKLLVVDDEREFLKSIQRFFLHRSFDVSIAENCMEALESIGKETFDVVVLDVKMPGEDGFECMKKIKENYPDIKIIFLTGHSIIEDGIQSIKKGAFDYCLKPIDPEELLEKVILAIRH